ncbi:MAG: chromosome segregation protein SMC [Clostridia bacterium]|nr:chromosome segregation protein SMC [Clostridia bacterium]
MFLKALEMQGFKSFPDKTVLQFDKGMTAVVGPNGSGKSNISDAVNWVLGEQSAKSLRSSKMEDVIFSGTQARRPMGYAEVTLKLDNGDRGLNYDADEVSVTRRYYRSGESEYKINGKAARLRDIHELFMDTGLGRDGYSMVGQGRVESIVSARSQDRREIFEEAAGISHYRYRRNDATRRLDQAEENLVRLRDIAGELESRIEPLRKQSEKAQKYLVLAQQRKDLEIGLWLHTLERSGELLRRQAEKIDITENQYNTAVRELDTIFADSNTAAESVRTLTADVEDARAAAARLEQSARDAEAGADLIQNKIEHNLAVIDRIKNDIAQETGTDQSIADRIRQAQAEAAALEQELQAAGESLAALEAEIADREQQEQAQLLQLAEKNNKLTRLNEDISRHRIAESSAQSAVQEIKSRAETLQKEKQERQAQEQTAAAQAQKHRETIDRQKEQATALENALSGYALRTELRGRKLAEARRTMEETGAVLSSTVSKKHMLQETERNMEGYQGSVRAVMKGAAAGALQGVKGPVSRLIQVPQQYAAAIETALGAAVQNIVTETDNDAKKAVYYLKNANAGRATFLPMSAVKARTLNENGLEDCAGFIDLASSLITYDSAYDGIMKNLLGRTVIAETLDDAVVIARKYNHRFKIVSLDGQVINAGGSITGGSGIRSSGFITRQGEIQRLEEKEAALRETYEKQKAQVASLTAETEKASAEQEGTRAEIFKLKERIAAEDGEMRVALSAADAAEQAVASIDAELAASERRLTQISGNSDAFGQLIRALTEEVAALTAEAAALREKADAAANERRALSENAASLQVKNAERAARRNASLASAEELERRKSGHTDKIEALKAESETLKAENETLAADAQTQRKTAEDYRAQRKTVDASIDDMIRKREEFETAVSSLRVKEREKSDEKERLAAELVRLQEKRESLEHERDNTEKKLFEEYNLTRREAAALGIEIENVAEAGKELSALKAKIKALGSVNVGAVDEYKEVSERYTFLHGQLEDAEKSKAELLRLIGELTDEMAKRFSEKFAEINQKFGETFVQLFGGGKAELVLEDESNALECGIEIKAQPPGKNVRSISLLSGGEKGLCAIALIFAILKVNPSPFCIFDEVEAALDDVNVVKFAEYVNSMTDRTQFILITHRRGSMEASDVMYGVTMQEHGVSKLLEMRTSETAKMIGIE